MIQYYKFKSLGVGHPAGIGAATLKDHWYDEKNKKERNLIDRDCEKENW